eukprot:COSAG04_NODE_15428_length_532_cov_0.824480_1_plen_20_part_10
MGVRSLAVFVGGCPEQLMGG